MASTRGSTSLRRVPSATRTARTMSTPTKSPSTKPGPISGHSGAAGHARQGAQLSCCGPQRSSWCWSKPMTWSFTAQ
eukprot:15631964-Heterocapsa_arctica.AAC.1